MIRVDKLTKVNLCFLLSFRPLIRNASAGTSEPEHVKVLARDISNVIYDHPGVDRTWTCQNILTN